MKSDSFRNNRKALAALLLCTGFIAGHPLSVMAEGNEQNVQIVQQQIKVSGMVKDVLGEPVIGATVLEKGTSNGIVTDIDGNFSLSVNPGVTLIISYIGYKTQEVQAVGGKSMNVTLIEDTETLDEVIVVGFGTQKKVNLTGSVGVATVKELESRPVASATMALQGLIPGLQISINTGEIDKTASINIRGNGTIGDGSSGSPLVLIDGMEGDLNTVNPQDIENISVLKDAAASSIYGSRAPFGVILVTTKSGKAGKVSVNYNNSFRIASPMNLPKMMDSYTFANFFNSAAINKGDNQVFSNETMQKMLDYQAGLLPHSLDARPDNPNLWEDTWTKGYANTDWYEETYKSSVFSQEHNVSVTGGTEKITRYASFNYLDQGGLLKLGDDGLERYNAAGKINATITDWLKIKYSTRFTRGDKHRPIYISNGSFYDYLGRQSWPNLPLYDPNGELMSNYPSILLEKGGKRNVRADQHYQQAALVLEPIKNWITNVELNYSIYDESMKQTTLPYNGYNADGSIIDKKEDTSLKQSYKKENYLNLNIYSSYSYTLNDTHNFKVMAGFQAEEMKQDYSETTKYGLMNEDMPEFDLTTGLNGKGEAKDPYISGNHSEWATAGFFGRLNYDYKGRYLAEVNMRYDGTSRFRRGNRWQLAPSFSLGWNVVQEAFWKPIANVVNTFKFRFSYGELSNQNTTAWYPTYRVMNLKSNDGSWLQDAKKPGTAEVGSLISTMLTWESVRSWNAGLDFGLFNNRLTGSVDVFTRYTKNMVGPALELPATLGVAVPKTNNCDLKTKGWELALTWRDRMNNGLGYGATVTLSDSKTIIDSYPGNTTESIWNYLNGHETNEIWGFETIGIAKTDEEMQAHLDKVGGQSALGSRWAAGDIMYKDLDGKPGITKGVETLSDHGDLKVIGNKNPHYFFSIDLNADWKGFDVRCFFQGVMKRDYWGDNNYNGYLFGVRGNNSMWHARAFVQHEDYFRAESIGLPGHEISANLDAYYPRPIFSESNKNQQTQTRYLQDASYIRLKNLQVGYTLPATWMRKVGLAKCRLFVSGENLWTGTSLSSLFDPETISGGNGGNAYPLSRTWSFGLSLTL
ncbi:MAG: TonB-dependent receptor [Bacteroides intestinalis]|nr:TonB-dependent receptor [Bacteroides intestinalis]